MSVSTNGFIENVLTFKADSALTAGVPVKMSGNNTVAACAAGNAICGVSTQVSRGYAGVQLTGFVTLPYTGSTPAPGLCGLCADGSGGVKTDADSKKYLVTSVNTASGSVSFML